MATRVIFIIIATALVVAGFYERAHNSASARAQVAAITSLDAAGHDATTAVASLKAYAQGHMGASVTFTLTAAYDRAVATSNTAASATASNAGVYAAAQAACSGKTDSITQAECNQSYINKHIVAEPNIPAPTPPQLSNYQYKLRAPIWTPDLAGAFFLGALAAAIVAIFYRRQGHR